MLILLFALLLALLAVPAVGSDIADAKTNKDRQSKVGKKASKGKFELGWGQFEKANRPAARILKKSGAMQRLVRRVNQMVTLPADIPVLFSDQIEEGPAYLPEVVIRGQKMGFIDMTGEFLTMAVGLLRPQVNDIPGLNARRAMILAMKSVLVHEMGHALVDKRRIPITGREEDAVDGFAAFVLMNTRGYGPMALFSTAALFDALGKEGGDELDVGNFADEHSLPQQRVYQLLCWIYGSNPKQYRPIVDDEEGLPRRRAGLCREEYGQLVHSWGTLIRDYGHPPRARVRKR